MAMKIGSDDGDERGTMTDINTTPLVDVYAFGEIPPSVRLEPAAVLDGQLAAPPPA